MGIRILLTMKPGLSREMHTVFPKYSESVLAVSYTCQRLTHLAEYLH